jgi:CxxC-x17-CxxC domain-containing protein
MFPLKANNLPRIAPELSRKGPGTSSTIVHFGQELADRFPLLRHAGYSINRYVTLLEFQEALRSGAEHHAVSFSHLEEYTWPLAALSARNHSSAPLIFFRTRSVISFPTSGAEGAEHVGMSTLAAMDFDLVVPPGAFSHVWIDDIAAAIARSRALRSRSGRLRDETRAVREKSIFERSRARNECARNTELVAGPARPSAASALPGDKLLTCSLCGVEFVFSAGEQLFFQSRNFFNDPQRCRKCRQGSERKKPPAGPETVVTCASCGVSTRVPFRPRQGRPVLCRSCFDMDRKRA